MSDEKTTAIGPDPSRHLNRARAALREAAECLEDAAAAGDHADLGVASARSHVDAARRAVSPFRPAADRDASERDAA